MFGLLYQCVAIALFTDVTSLTITLVTVADRTLLMVRTAVLQQNVLAKSLDNFKLSTVIPFVEFYTTMVLVNSDGTT